MKVEFTGLQELQAEFKTRLDVDNIVEPTVKQAAEYLKKQLEENVYSYGFKKRTGKSRDSIVIDSEVKNGTIKVGLSNQRSDAFYLYFHEFGTKKMPARPWFRPTFENEMNRIIELMSLELKRRMRL